MADDPLHRFPEFARAVSARLEAGRASYGDKSFSRHPAVLCGEIEQELLDVMGWGYILWRRMRELREALEGVAKDRTP
ncbi:MAG: hypothetical protein IT370_09345 [Deltaproteobacteria bacterium]|nr:hypothetical protein [Deltaproteobacteria bacterium]